MEIQCYFFHLVKEYTTETESTKQPILYSSQSNMLQIFYMLAVWYASSLISHILYIRASIQTSPIHLLTT